MVAGERNSRRPSQWPGLGRGRLPGHNYLLQHLASRSNNWLRACYYADNGGFRRICDPIGFAKTAD